jgi:hypothetical protein
MAKTRSDKDEAIPTEPQSKAVTAGDVNESHSAWIGAIANLRKTVAAREKAKMDSERFAREANAAQAEVDARQAAYLDALESTGIIPPKQ